MNRIKLIIFFISTISTFSFSQNELQMSGNLNVREDEGEAHIAIHPNDSLKIVTGHMVSGGAGGLKFNVYNTLNGGYSWNNLSFDAQTFVTKDFPKFKIAGGGDIVFAFDKTGKLYCSWILLLIDSTKPIPATYDSAKFVAYWAESIDYGQTFTFSPGEEHFFGQGLYDPVDGTILNYKDGVCDRQWMAVDLSNGINKNNLYVGFINYLNMTTTPALKIRTKKSFQTSFGPPVSAYTGSGQFTNIAVDDNGVLHYTFCDLQLNEVRHVSSSDGGATFGTSTIIHNSTRLSPRSNYYVNNRENGAPSLAIDGSNNLHIVWGDFPSGQVPKSYYSKSIDGGVTWSNPLDLSTIFGSYCFMPVLSSINDKVTIGGNVLDTSKKSEYFIASSSDNGVNFSTPTKVSTGITDFTTIGLTPFVGDYSSAVRTSCDIFSLWTDCRSNGCKQYLGRYNECGSTGVVELTPLNSTFTLDKIYPNPVVENLDLTINSEIIDELQLELFNSQGGLIETNSWKVFKGVNNNKLNVSSYQSGNYLLRITNKKGVYITRKIMKH